MLLLFSLSATRNGICFTVFSVCNTSFCRNDISFLVTPHHLVFRGCTKRALTRWKHDFYFWQEEGCGGDVLSVLIFWLDCISAYKYVRTIMHIVDKKIINIALLYVRICMH